MADNCEALFPETHPLMYINKADDTLKQQLSEPWQGKIDWLCGEKQYYRLFFHVTLRTFVNNVHAYDWITINSIYFLLTSFL